MNELLNTVSNEDDALNIIITIFEKYDGELETYEGCTASVAVSH